MQKVFKNSKQILAFVFAFVILAVSLVTGSVTAEACDISKVDYWDGTLATKFSGGSGTEASPYIIKTAEELAYCCLGLDPDTTGGKYYKVDDSVKTFVMQPESIADIDVIKALDTPDAVAAYFDALDGKINWMSKFNNKSFNGNFDGNGATVYGLYADGEAAAKDDVGLFPQYDGGKRSGTKRLNNICKNIAVKNSYFKTKRRLGAIAGAAYGTSWGAKFDGQVTIDTCAVVNCYMVATVADAPDNPATTDKNEHSPWSFFTEQGVVAGGGATDVIKLNNILVSNVYAFNTERNVNINLVGNGSTKTKDEKYQNTVTDSIILGIAPYVGDYYSKTVHEPEMFTNVITDMETGEVVFANPSQVTKDYTDHIFSITETGVAFKEAANMLDWNKTWIMTANGPELQKFHGDVKLVTTATTHFWQCLDCGVEYVGGAEAHKFVLVGDTIVGDGSDVYMCTDCEYICAHKQTPAEYDPGDCVTKAGVYTRCEICDWYMASSLSDAPGHKFEHVEADIGDCETLGHKEYWECSECKNKFTSDDAFAPMSAATTDAALSTGYGPHTKECDDNGKEIILYDENGHWYKCAVNGGRLDLESNDLGATGVIKHKFKNSKCVDCGYFCETHIYKATGNIDVAHSCDKDEMSEIKCERCGYKTTVMTKKACHTIVKMEKVLPTDQMEGTKEHYKCEVCKEIYTDEAGTTKAINSTLIIPKVLSAEYIKMINADTGVTSPSTGDSVASLFAVVALAGVAFVASRKVNK